MTSPWIARVLGGALLGHYIFVVGLKLSRGRPEDLLWMSHVALLLAALGLLTRRPRLLSTALTCVLLLHTMWLVDAAVGLTAGLFPLGIATYLADADALTWIGTLHHFYLVPLLIVLVVRCRCFEPAVLAAASALFAVLSILSRCLTPPSVNVNSAFGLPRWDLPVFDLVSGLPAVPYLLALNAIVTGVFFFPAAALLLRRAGRMTSAGRPAVA